MTAVEVRLHGGRVGVLAHRSELDDATEFSLDREYRDRADRPVLGQIFEDDPERVWRTSHRVPEWFSNLLPEGRLRELLAERAGVHPDRELHLLAALGEDLPGAVTAHSLDPDGSTAPTGSLEEVGREEPLRFSLAGLQLKLVVDVDDRGVTVPVRGQGGRWIAKLPDPRFAEVPRNEHAMLTWAERSGIAVPTHELVELERVQGLPHLPDPVTGPALLVLRFDRTADGGRVHMEDFAQIRNVYPWRKYGGASYDSVGRVILGLCGLDAFRAYVDRLVFMVLSGNADLHLKNWSVLYPDRRRAALSPAYDLVSTVAFPGVDDRLALKLGDEREFREVSAESFDRLARRAGVDPVGAAVRDTASRIRAEWPMIRDLLPRAQADPMEAHLRRLRL